MFKALKSLNFFCNPFFNYIRQLLNSKNFSIPGFFYGIHVFMWICSRHVHKEFLAISVDVENKFCKTYGRQIIR